MDVMRSSTPRRGSGVVATVAVAALVLATVLGLAAAFRTRGGTRLVENVVAGEQAHALARAALTEAWTALRTRLADPADPWSAALRRPLTEADRPVAFVLEPEATRALARATPDQAALVGSVSLSIPRQFALWTHNPLEKVCTVEAGVTVTVDRPAIGRRATRRLRQWRQVKVVYPAPPRPLDGYTLFVLLPWQFRELERSYRALQLGTEGMIREIERQVARAAGEAVTVPRPFERPSPAGVYACFPYYGYPPFPYNRDLGRRLPDRFTEFAATGFRDPSVLNETIGFDESNLSSYLVSLVPRLTGEDAQLRWPEALAGLVTAAGEGRTPTPDGLRQAMADYEQGLSAELDRYLGLFGFVDRSSRDDFNESFLRPLVASDLASGTATVTEALAWFRGLRATHDFPDEGALWRHLGRNPARLNGIYFVDGPVTVDTTFVGRGTIASRNRLVVRRCARDGSADDDSLCTLMSFADGEPGARDWQSIELQADAEAALVSLSGEIKDLHRHRVRGSVAVARLSREAVAGDDGGRPFPWTIEYDEALAVTERASGAPLTERAVVVLSPTLVRQTLERSL